MLGLILSILIAQHSMLGVLSCKKTIEAEEPLESQENAHISKLSLVRQLRPQLVDR